MTPLERALRERIRTEGPLTGEAFMEACNSYYYATRDPLGAAGDFTTAPEISQMFGELVGAALADVWARAGRPANARYVELGPGRGTLASDALRVMRSAGLVPPVHFVETSETLRAAQKAAIPDATWHEHIEHLPGDGPLLVVANEFLDALPIRQHVGGIERRIVITAGQLAFDRDGEIVETSPARDGAVRAISERLVALGGMALVIDYGHERTAPGDTLQAVRRHGFTPVLVNPGEQDLTSHVDFQRVGEIAREAGAVFSGPAEQGPWLERLGIMARARMLANAAPERAAEIEGARARLCRPDQMGSLFKVLAISAPEWPTPAGL
ncbi:SAM-dependent methyltransferase [Sphingomonas sp. BN140010]|uniref:SAM-dependent methyltransferase n=1 Tax=Sphingomonas arvum TaxID=2992113 RepID=A0ABT3JG98_9SPHN|nr:SAM-dependent methyltransferase [Sphingomonas sp. BN140010]MCW3798095.1 SAM-dependent methyltransferase [Sphingomonas sp. BN140010]